MSAAKPDAFGSYLEKWLEAEPDARLLRLFVPDAREPATVAALVLLHELETAAFALDPQPARAKLAWWQEELNRWVDGTPRHPITLALGAVAPERAFAELPARMARWLVLDTVERFEQWRTLAVDLAGAQERALGGVAVDVDPAPVLARILAHFPRLGPTRAGCCRWTCLQRPARPVRSSPPIPAPPRAGAYSGRSRVGRWNRPSPRLRRPNSCWRGPTSRARSSNAGRAVATPPAPPRPASAPCWACGARCAATARAR